MTGQPCLTAGSSVRHVANEGIGPASVCAAAVTEPGTAVRGRRSPRYQSQPRRRRRAGVGGQHGWAISRSPHRPVEAEQHLERLRVDGHLEVKAGGPGHGAPVTVVRPLSVGQDLANLVPVEEAERRVEQPLVASSGVQPVLVPEETKEILSGRSSGSSAGSGLATRGAHPPAAGTG